MVVDARKMTCSPEKKGRVMKIRLPLRFWIETAFGVASAVVLAMTLVWPDWIERIFGLEPDAGDGSAEWGWAVAFAVAALVLFADAGRTWWRTAHRSEGSRDAARSR
jgi:hypothetical protein